MVSETVSSKYFVILDEINNKLYQATYEPSSIHAIEIASTNKPTSIAFDSNSGTVAWADATGDIVKIKIVGKDNEEALALSKESGKRICIRC